MDLRDLIRCKCVCKSWESFISGSRFVKAHLNHSCHKNENGHRRITEAVFWMDVGSEKCLFIGSSNGLVCVHNYDFGLLVGNPSTREGRTLPTTPIKWSSCWGFGYDSLMDDYKVVIGDMTCNNRYTRFQVFSLKSNAWNVIGKVNYICLNNFCGVLCNGAIHWVMHPRNNIRKQVIISFDLSREKLKEIPQPDVDEGYVSLGLMKECLCIHRDGKSWVMKKYNDKRSWEMLPDNIQIQFKYGCRIFEKEDDTFHTQYQFIGNRMFRFEGGPTIVESLVSPHLQAEKE